MMAESIPLEDAERGKKSKPCRYFKMQALQRLNAVEIGEGIQNNFNEKSIVFSNKSSSYVNISDFVEVHVCEIPSEETSVELLPWLHIAISHLKCTLLGIYHKIKES